MIFVGVNVLFFVVIGRISNNWWSVASTVRAHAAATRPLVHGAALPRRCHRSPDSGYFLGSFNAIFFLCYAPKERVLVNLN